MEFFRFSLLPIPCSATHFPAPSLEGLGREELGLGWDGTMWAVPKKRTSYTRKRIRNGRKQLKPKLNYTVCPECKNLKLLHVLCGYCFKETMKKTAKIRTAELEAKMAALAEKAKNALK